MPPTWWGNKVRAHTPSCTRRAEPCGWRNWSEQVSQHRAAPPARWDPRVWTAQTVTQTRTQTRTCTHRTLVDAQTHTHTCVHLPVGSQANSFCDGRYGLCGRYSPLITTDKFCTVFCCSQSFLLSHLVLRTLVRGRGCSRDPGEAPSDGGTSLTSGLLSSWILPCL